MKKYFNSTIKKPKNSFIGFDIHNLLFNNTNIDKNDNNTFHFNKIITESIKKIRNENIPITFISNHNGVLEKDYSNDISDKLQLENQYKIKEEEVILNHTPIKELADQYKDDIVLITGLNNDNNELIAKSYNFKKFITREEYSDLFPLIVPNRRFLYNTETIEVRRKEAKLKVEKRLGGLLPGINLDNPPKIKSIVSLTSDMEFQDTVQVNNYIAYY